ncbi:hypothetical protein [Deinococcus hopiensis]|uniref:Uncharacterized protein n=1 Tax=Deinococcus hopiensis KR-140 TaxID=695939 RepID=A0A1W1UXF2_9DEIO|nr:hypothetical protein [Deinococcus hopiensis]SMB85752.1 hypothetical protein SAMN00790413_03525 [Deinococcus hopiensis KR-140]
MALRNAFDGVATETTLAALNNKAATDDTLQQLSSIFQRLVDVLTPQRPYARTVQDAMNVNIVGGGHTVAQYWGASNVYPLYYGTGSPNSVDAREEWRELSMQTAQAARNRWTIT